MRRQAVRVARLSVGIALLILGVIGLFMPILQGWLFIIAGLSVMAPESPRAHRALEWLKDRLRGRRHGGAQSVGRAADCGDRRTACAEREQPAERLASGGTRNARAGAGAQKHKGGHG